MTRAGELLLVAGLVAGCSSLPMSGPASRHRRHTAAKSASSLATAFTPSSSRPRDKRPPEHIAIGKQGLQRVGFEGGSVSSADKADWRLTRLSPGETVTRSAGPQKCRILGRPLLVSGETAERGPDLTAAFPPAPAAESNDGKSVAEQPQGHRIDFATALALVLGQNPKVAFAQEQVNEAEARLEAARTLWLPSIRAGVSYNKHDGQLQNSAGRILDVNRSSLQSGLGVGAVGTGTQPFPGISVQFHLADAIFQPLIAERSADARESASAAAGNDLLLEAALAYLELLRSVQAETIATETLDHARELVRQTTAFAKSGQGPQADTDRAQTEFTLRKNDVTRAREAVEVASARLAEVLSLDATLDLRPAERAVTPVELVSPGSSLNDLLTTALSNRPEVSENQALVAAALERLTRERLSPWVPNVLVGVSTAGFGGGRGTRIDAYNDRFDFDAVAYWEVRQLGFGEKAARDAAHARVHQAKDREVQMIDRIAREVSESFAQVRSRKRQIAVARSGIQSAQASYRRNLERIRQGQGLPIEVLQAVQALDQAHREYLRVVTEYNQAQFRLHRALGWPIQ